MEVSSEGVESIDGKSSGDSPLGVLVFPRTNSILERKKNEDQSRPFRIELESTYLAQSLLNVRPDVRFRNGVLLERVASVD